jgi:hypothetical protein
MLYIIHALPYFNSYTLLFFSHFNSCTSWCHYVIQSVLFYTRCFTHWFLSVIYFR